MGTELSKLEDRILGRVKEAYSDILTGEELKQLVDSAFAKFTQPTINRLYVRADVVNKHQVDVVTRENLFSIELTSPVNQFQALAMEEILYHVYKDAIRSLQTLASGEYNKHGDTIASEAVVKIMEQHASTIFANFISNFARIAADEAVRNMTQRNYYG